jgi:hypothetical protein
MRGAIVVSLIFANLGSRNLRISNFENEVILKATADM